MLTLSAIAVVGVIAGTINTLAGGGSLLTLPALMLFGLPADIANGTNRLSIVTQSVSAVAAFGKQGNLPTDAVASTVAPTLAGAVVGAIVATRVPEHVLEPILLGTMIAIAALIAFKRSTLIPDGREPNRLKGTVGLFVAGLYGGFIQAGVGFVLLAVLAGTLGHDLVRANALKLVCVLVFGIAALGVFVLAGQVAWRPAIALAVGAVIGAQLGAALAPNIPMEAFRWLVFACVVCACVAVWVRN